MNYQNFRNFYPQDHQPIFLLFDVLKYCFIWALSGVHKVLLWCLCGVYVGFMWFLYGELTDYKTILEQLLFPAVMNRPPTQSQMLLVLVVLRIEFQEHSLLTFQLTFFSFFFDPE